MYTLAFSNRHPVKASQTCLLWWLTCGALSPAHTHTFEHSRKRAHKEMLCNVSQQIRGKLWIGLTHTHIHTSFTAHWDPVLHHHDKLSEFDCVCMRVVASQYMDTLQCFPEDRVVGVAQVCKYYFCTCKAFPAGRFLCVCRHYTGSRGLSMYNNLNSCIHQNLAWLLTSRSVGSPPNILNC